MSPDSGSHAVTLRVLGPVPPGTVLAAGPDCGRPPTPYSFSPYPADKDNTSAGRSLATPGTGFSGPPLYYDGPACLGLQQRPLATQHPEHGPELPNGLSWHTGHDITSRAHRVLGDGPPWTTSSPGRSLQLTPHQSPGRPRALNQPTSGAPGSRLPATLGHITAGPAPTANSESCIVSHKASTSQHIGGPTPTCVMAPAYQDLARPWLVAALSRPRPWLFLLSHCGTPRLPHHSIFECALQFSFMAGRILQPYWTRDLWDHGMVGLQHCSTTSHKSSSSGSGLVLASSCPPWLAQAPPQYTCKEGPRTHHTTCTANPSLRLAGHHSSITPGTLNGPGLPAATTHATTQTRPTSL
jgi:hypothetical protein